MKNLGHKVSLLLVLMMGFSTAAVAAKYGVVLIDGTPLIASTAADGAVLETLARGAMVGASDQAYGGYYRVRSRAGNIGWIAVDRLQLRDYPQAAGGTPTSSAGQVSAPFQRFVVNGFGGLRFLALGEISQATLNASGERFSFPISYDFGGQFSVYALRWLSFGLRVEYLLTSTLGQDGATTYQYTFQSSALPITGGVEFAPLNNDRVALRFGGYAGYAPVLNFTVTQISGGSDTLLLSQPAFTALGKAELAVKFGKHFQVQLQSGYRYITTPTLDLSANSTGNVQALFTTTQAPVNLSGIFVQLGIGVGF